MKDRLATEQNLRQRAEETVGKETPSAEESVSPEQMKQMLHKHRVHLVEMEIQNEELQTTQEELAASLARYFDFYNMAPVAYFTVDEDGLIQEANDTAATMLGTALGALLRQPLNRFILKDDQDFYYLHRKQLFAAHSENSKSPLPQGQAANACELRMTKMDGSLFWGHLLTTVSQAAEGSLVSRIMLSDITDRKQLETEIQDALEYSENIVETVREPLVVLNSNLKILSANQSFFDTFKVTSEETIGNFIYDLGNRQWDIPKLRVLFEDILSHETVFNDYEVEHDFQDIGFKIILLNARQIFRINIGSHIILLAMEDITERRRVERELQLVQEEIVQSNRRLEQLSRIKSDFLANMSHELRTPLNSVIGFSEVLQDQLHGPINDKQQEFVNNILSSGKHLLLLINDALDLSKVEAGKMELELSAFRLRELLDASLMILMEKAVIGELALHLEYDPQPDLEIVADQRKLKQIMCNLLSNAVKFTPKGGSVRVYARRVSSVGEKQVSSASPASDLRANRGDISDKGEAGEALASPLQHDRDFIEITVTDTGIGIKEDDIPKLFLPFTQLESVYTKEFAGTGLGLALTRKLVELHGGRIWVESEFGKGSRFIITIPLTHEPKEQP